MKNIVEIPQVIYLVNYYDLTVKSKDIFSIIKATFVTDDGNQLLFKYQTSHYNGLSHYERDHYHTISLKEDFDDYTFEGAQKRRSNHLTRLNKRNADLVESVRMERTNEMFTKLVEMRKEGKKEIGVQLPNTPCKVKLSNIMVLQGLDWVKTPLYLVVKDKALKEHILKNPEKFGHEYILKNEESEKFVVENNLISKFL